MELVVIWIISEVINRLSISLGFCSEENIFLVLSIFFLVIGIKFLWIKNRVNKKQINSIVVVIKKMVCNFQWLVRKLFVSGLSRVLFIVLVDSVFSVQLFLWCGIWVVIRVLVLGIKLFSRLSSVCSSRNCQIFCVIFISIIMMVILRVECSSMIFFFL